MAAQITDEWREGLLDICESLKRDWEEYKQVKAFLERHKLTALQQQLLNNHLDFFLNVLFPMYRRSIAEKKAEFHQG